MSIFAGIYCRRENVPLPISICKSLRRLVSRNTDDDVQVFEDRRTFFVKVDIGAFGEAGHFAGPNGSVSIIAGEPLLSSPNNATWQSREFDLAQIQDSFATGKVACLENAQGVFCLVNYQPDEGILHLATDKLGVRPLYYWIDEKHVIFSTALRIFEELPNFSKRMNLRAIAEIAGLGYALNNRTPYINISLLEAGEILKVTDLNVSRSFYWKWNKIETSSAPEKELLEELAFRFDNAVSKRLRNDSSTIAYLSGGLDSRCVVASLCKLGAHVHTFNFARPNTQDQILGRLFAERINVTHAEVPKKAGDLVPDFSSLMSEGWRVSRERNSRPPERPLLVWSGEGGSVDLGHVHLTQEIADLMRACNIDAAIQAYIRNEHVHVSPKLLRPEIFKLISEVVPSGISEELSYAAGGDPARTFYLFLLLNDQRRKLAGHFEGIDIHRIEFQLPFFDSSFLESIVSFPVDFCLKHKLYVKWLKHFPKAVTSVPWQAYPGHEPCPLPIPAGISYQWETEYQKSEQLALRQTLSERAREILRSKDFPSDILNKSNLWLTAIAHRSGWRDYSYIIDTAGIFHEYWRKCEGKYSLD